MGCRDEHETHLRKVADHLNPPAHFSRELCPDQEVRRAVQATSDPSNTLGLLGSSLLNASKNPVLDKMPSVLWSSTLA